MEKRVTISGLKTASAKNMANLTIINIGLVILLVNFEKSFHEKIGFSIIWYEEVGIEVLKTMLMTIGITVISNLIGVVKTGLKRCIDRGC